MGWKRKRSKKNKNQKNPTQSFLSLFNFHQCEGLPVPRAEASFLGFYHQCVEATAPIGWVTRLVFVPY